MSAAAATAPAPMAAAPPEVDRSHAVVTAASPRAPSLFPARIAAVEPLSPTVVRLLLAVSEEHRAAAAFHPGQWVDAHLPGVPMIGGYSLCSTPRVLREQGVLELAVKRSAHPPAKWVHEHAKPGVEVQLQVGGAFVYDEDEARRHGLLPAADEAVSAAAAGAAMTTPLTPPDSAPALFLVGGVGITPLISMARYRAERLSAASAAPGSGPAPLTTFIYSARHVDELVFRAELEALATAGAATRAAGAAAAPFRLFLSTTAQTRGQHAEGADAWQEAPARLNTGRVPLELLRRELRHVADARGHVFLCGPPGMVDELLPLLQQHIADPRRVHFERWW